MQSQAQDFINDDVAMLTAGTPVAYKGAGTVWAARADTVSRAHVVGLLEKDAAVGAVANVVRSGFIWMTGLTAGSAYYLAPTGGATTTKPTGSGHYVVLLGIATGVNCLNLDIESEIVVGTAGEAHGVSHKSGGSDAVKLDEFAAPTDVTTLNATTSLHGLLPKLGGGTSNFLRADGAWAAPGGSGDETKVTKSADETNNTGALVNATDLAFSVTSGVLYQFRFVLIFRSGTATVGMRASVTFPVVTVFAGRVQIPFAGDGSDHEFVGAITSSGDAVVATAVPATNTDYVAFVEGVIQSSAIIRFSYAANKSLTSASILRFAADGKCASTYNLPSTSPIEPLTIPSARLHSGFIFLLPISAVP